MKRSLLTIALLTVTATASAQTVTLPAVTSPDIANRPMNGQISSETEANAAVTANGLASVSSLNLGADGKWYGSAMRGGQAVALTVDVSGNVSSR